MEKHLKGSLWTGTLPGASVSLYILQNPGDLFLTIWATREDQKGCVASWPGNQTLVSCMTSGDTHHYTKCSGCDGLCRSTAERSYPTPEVRGGSWEELPHVQGRWPRVPGCNIHLSSHFYVSEARGGDQECQAAMAQELPRGATPRPRSGVVAETSYPTSKDWWLHGCRRTERGYSTFKVRRGNLLQSKEQRLHFAGAAMKRYPTSKVRETQVRW